MLEENYLESTIRWNLYRRWKRRTGPHRFCERLFHNVMRTAKPGVFVDCGANVGDITSAARRHGRQVICFEPDLDALAVLRRRFQNDSCVEIIAKAVGNSDRTAEFYQPPGVAAGKIGQTTSSSIIKTSFNNGLVRTVEVVDIVRFIKELGKPIAVMKMDIEGLEAECLEAMFAANIVQDIGYLLVETHERFSDDLFHRISKIREYIADNKINNIALDWI